MARPPSRAAQAAGWIAEALSTGNPLATLPPGMAPRDRAEGERVALLALDALGLVVCGVRMLDGIAGPMIEGRLLPDGAAAAGLRHLVATAAIVAVLAEALDADGDASPVLSAVHPALDVSDSRFTLPPRGAALRAADLAGLGLVMAGPAAAGGMPDALLPVAVAARRMGGLPAGALLVAAGLSAPLTPDAAGMVTADLGALGRATARLT